MRRQGSLLFGGVVLAAVLVVAGCSELDISLTGALGGESSGTSTISVRGQSFTIPFGSAGVIALTAGETVSASGSARLFAGDPAEVPESGMMTLSRANVSVSSGAVGQASSRALPFSGTATVRVSLAEGGTAVSCDGAAFLAEYVVAFTMGVVSVVAEEQALSASALEAIIGNDVVICTEVTSDFDGSLGLSAFGLTFDAGADLPTFLLSNGSGEAIGLLLPGELFGPSNLVPAGGTRIATLDTVRAGAAIEIRAGSNRVGLLDSTACAAVSGTNYVATAEWSDGAFGCTVTQSPLAADAVDGGEADDGTIQVSIDSVSGAAVIAPPTDTYGGVAYAVVGVLDAATADAPAGVDSDSVTIDLSVLGLGSVERIHLATYSAWVPDVADGVTIGTLTLSFADSTGSETVPLVLGSNTSEWSHARTEHTSDFGGVRHGLASVLYSFDTAIDSSSTYSGHVYEVGIDLDPPRPLARIDLSVSSVGNLGARPDADTMATWAAQSVAAITLVGSRATADASADAETGDVSNGTDGDESSTAPTTFGIATGTVTNAVTGATLSGALVTVDGTLASVTTGGDGVYVFEDLPTGAHTLRASLSGFVSTSVTIAVPADGVVQTVLELFGAGTITGEVVDAQTGARLPGVLITVVGTEAVATTDTSGAFTIDDAPEGSRTLSATLMGYVPSTIPVVVTAGESVEVSIGLLALGAGGDGVAVVLSWGATPRDLDLHMSGPDGSGGRFHIAFFSLSPVPHGSLDLDDVTSFGPETVTVSPTDGEAYVAGSYHVWIHNFTGEAGFDVSGGVVTLFASRAQFAQYQVENAIGDSSGRIWRVVEFDLATDGVLSNVNALESFAEGSSNSEF